MIRRFLVPLLGTGLLLGATAGSALAKCEEQADPKPAFCSEVVVSVSVAGGGMAEAGTRESLLINVSQGEQPFSAIGVVLTLLDADGTRVRAPAVATSPGLWTAEVTLPSAGSWSVMAQVVTDTGAAYGLPVYSEWGEVLPVLPPAEEAPTTAAPVTPTPASPVLPIALLLGLLAAGAAAGLLMRDRARRRTAEVPVAVGSATTADRA
ncbi:MAG: hypothetical protein H0W81_07840 [Chloroflexi bacterium]|nr:hypothetical protein [Chloroflexota bacterium]